METKESLRATIFNHFHHLCRYIREHWDQLVISWLMVCLFLGVIWASYRYVPPAELVIRHTLVTSAEKYLGCNEADGSHQQIIDLYNSYTPLPRAYAVTYEDNWCAAFASALTFSISSTQTVRWQSWAS